MAETKESETQRLAPFVPRLALDLARRSDADGSVDVHVVVEGSMLSADISGFTALSERLARKGREGAEELTSLINSCFTALIETADRFGGEVIKFGGDALLILFRDKDHQRRAGHAAQALQVILHHSVGTARRANLSMTVGVAEGPFNAFLVGSPARELLLCGPKATEVIRLEATAGQGQTLSSPAIARAVIGEPSDEGVVIWNPSDERDPDQEQIPTDLTPFVPTAVVEQLSAFSDTGGEHRLVAVGFVSLTGIAEALETSGPAATARELGVVVNAINNACSEFSVTALHSDIAPDGIKFVLCAGAPLSAGNSSDALLQAALTISRVSSPFVLKQGVQRGRVFAGFLGSTTRRNYTLMGDPVNTAARMLGRADDRDIVAVNDVVRDTRSVFIAEELEPFLVKGKAEPISAFKVLEITTEVRRSGEYADLVGREAELATLNDAIQTRGAFVHLVGAGGAGKSRLIDEVRDAVDLAGFGRFQATASPYGSASPYALFRGLLRSGFGMDIHTDAETTGDLLTKVVKQYAPQLTPWIPLLAAPFGARVEATPETEALGAEFRRAKTHEVVADFLDTAFDLPIALIAEDVHWVDDASLDLFHYLAEQTAKRGWVTFSTQRPTPGFSFATDIDTATFLEIDALADDAVRALAIDVSTEPLTDQQIDLVVGKAGGNPLFAIELARAVSRGGSDQLPDSVEKLISSRLDELSPGARRLLRIASIFGMTLKESELMAVLAVEAADLDPAWDEVAEFLSRSSDGAVAFSNIVTHDAAYQGLPFRARRRLHGIVGEHIEESTDHPERIAGLLATHFSEAKQHGKAWKYGVLGGDAATATGASVEAVASYSLAVDSARYVPKLETAELVRVTTALADSQYVLGHFDEARKSLQYARKRNEDLPAELELMSRIAKVEEREGRLKEALRWISRAENKLPDDVSDTELLKQRAQLGLSKAAIYHRRGEHDAVLTSATKSLADAELSGDVPSVALANERIHLAMMYPPQEGSEDFGLRASELYDRLGDHVSKARILNNLGIDAYFAGHWTLARERYGDAMTEGLLAGSAIDGPMGGLNKGEILSDQGHWEEAAGLLNDVLRNWRATGYPLGVAVGELYLGTTSRRQGKWKEAEELLDSAIVKLEQTGAGAYVTDAQARRLEVDVFQGRVNRAEIDAFMDTLGPDSGLRPRLLRLSALAYHLSGQPQDALEQMLQAAELTTGHERGLALRGLMHVAPDHVDVAKWTSEAAEILEQLEVVALAAFPG